MDYLINKKRLILEGIPRESKYNFYKLETHNHILQKKKEGDVCRKQQRESKRMKE